MYQRKTTIINRTGIHARPASVFVNEAKKFQSNIILSQEKKEVDKVIINSAELEKYFGKDKSPREMKDKIISLLDDWKAKQPPELGKPEKKTDLEK